MNNEAPTSEPTPATDADRPNGPDGAARNVLRLKIFALTFLAVAAIGMVYSFAQPTSYESRATLRVAKGATLKPSAAMTDAQYIASQPRLLLNADIIAKTRTQLASAGFSGLDSGEIRGMLSIEAIGIQRLLVIRAQGKDAELLPKVIDTWLDVYQKTLAAESETDIEQAEQAIPPAQAQSDIALVQAKTELAAFRKANKITSAGPNKKEAAGQMQALKRSLRDATAQEEKAQAALFKAKNDIAHGVTVAPKDQLREIQNQERKLQGLTTKLAELDVRYTRKFLALDPNLRVLPQQIKDLEVEVERLKTEGSQSVLDELKQKQREARRNLADLQLKIDAQQQRDQQFTSIAAQHAALVSAVERLENQRQKTGSRLIQNGAVSVAEYPQLSIAHRATPSRVLEEANTNRNIIIALVCALAAALFAAWLYGFLNPLRAPVAAATPRPEAETGAR